MSLRSVAASIGICNKADLLGIAFGPISSLVQIKKERQNLRALVNNASVHFTAFESEKKATNKRITRRIFELVPVVGILAYAVVQIAIKTFTYLRSNKVQTGAIDTKKIADGYRGKTFDGLPFRSNDPSVKIIDFSNTETLDVRPINEIEYQNLFVIKTVLPGEKTPGVNKDPVYYAFDLTERSDVDSLVSGINPYNRDRLTDAEIQRLNVIFTKNTKFKFVFV
jgi:hypothetical protein